MPLYLLCGLAFSGKSTLAAALAERVQGVVVSLDEINAERGLLGGLGIPDEEWGRTHAEALARVEQGLRAGRPVIVDDTNCFRFLRDNYRAVAERCGVDTKVVYLDCPLSLVQERLRQNEKTLARASVTQSVLLDLVQKLEVPTSDEDVFRLPTGIAPEDACVMIFGDERLA